MPRNGLSQLVRRQRYSLRSLFLVMTVVCLLLSAWSVYVNPYRLQARSLAEVNRLQGEASSIPADGPAWHRWLVVTLLGDGTFVHVTRVDLSGRNVDDQVLRSLTGLTYLQELGLDHTKITDDGAQVLLSMPALSRLSLRYTRISDRSAGVLRQLPKLTNLILTGTKFSDESVRELAQIRSLSELYVRWTKISDDGAGRLTDALPACRVVHHALVASASSAAQ